MKILVDTCAFLWIASDSARLSKAATAAFLDRNNERYLSAASAWEIGIKYAAGRLPLAQRPDRFVPRVREASGMEPLEMDEESALLAARLPGYHQDPFDRILIGQAIVHGMIILSPDPEFARYAVRVLW